MQTMKGKRRETYRPLNRGTRLGYSLCAVLFLRALVTNYGWERRTRGPREKKSRGPRAIFILWSWLRQHPGATRQLFTKTFQRTR